MCKDQQRRCATFDNFEQKHHLKACQSGTYEQSRHPGNNDVQFWDILLGNIDVLL